MLRREKVYSTKHMRAGSVGTSAPSHGSTAVPTVHTMVVGTAQRVDAERSCGTPVPRITRLGREHNGDLAS